MREKKTVKAMVVLHCRKNHSIGKGMCSDCQELLEYAFDRIDKCPLIENKPTCADCPIHCYERSRRDRIRAVMRYSGPRMLYRHPVLAIRHLNDGRKKPARKA